MTGGPLDAALVRKARMLEIEYCKSRKIAKKVPIRVQMLRNDRKATHWG